MNVLKKQSSDKRLGFQFVNDTSFPYLKIGRNHHDIRIGLVIAIAITHQGY